MASIERRETKSGEVRWEVRYRALDGSERSRTWKTKRDAKRFADGVETDKVRGGFVDPRSGLVLLRDYSAQWMKSRTDLRERTRETYEDLLRLHIVPQLGDTPLAQLTVERVRQWHSQLAKKYSSTAAKSYRLLRVVLNAAVLDERIMRNPCQVKGAGVERAAERPTVTPDQVWALADAIEPRYRIAVLLAGFAGLRVGEILGLEHRHLNLLHRSLVVEQQQIELKSGDIIVTPPKTAAGRRVLTLPDFPATEIGDHLRTYGIHGRGDRVLPGERGGPLRRFTLHKHWNRARAKVELPDGFRFHDLRHTANTLAANTGASTRELMHRMGHASSAAALRYQHVTQERERALADALNKVAARPAREVFPTT